MTVCFLCACVFKQLKTCVFITSRTGTKPPNRYKAAELSLVITVKRTARVEPKRSV